ncbi:3'-5' exoribonuclease domain-containing protein [Arthrobacter sp.]|uniref:3'-5' exoribonuclease domain-containing protein n=1 Tax=Arthrobacter sp. TaxID=1667 RepID=UPI003A902957
MKYFYDTEFLEDGKTIELISIAIVAEDGREYYAVNADMPVDRIKNHPWLMKNVWPSLPTRGVRGPGHLDDKSTTIRPYRLIANEVREFLTATPHTELWAWYGAYDHVALAQLFGPMVELPSGIPMYTNDVRSLVDWEGTNELPKQADGVHNALADARHVKVMHEFIVEQVAGK